MIARSKTSKVLNKYRLSFHPTLTEKYYLDDKLPSNADEILDIDEQEQLALTMSDPLLSTMMNNLSESKNIKIPNVTKDSSIVDLLFLVIQLLIVLLY